VGSWGSEGDPSLLLSLPHFQILKWIIFMALVLTNGPSLEPVSLDEAKAHLRVDHLDEDVLIASLVTAARVHLETMLGLSFITQHWNVVLDKWPDALAMALPLFPVQAITGLSLYDSDDVASLIDPSYYSLDAISDPPRLIWRGSSPRPVPGRAFNGIEISLSAGFGVAAHDVPQPLERSFECPLKTVMN
jgi:uncharacterized phiE125 gp8 family phage protein